MLYVMDELEVKLEQIEKNTKLYKEKIDNYFAEFKNKFPEVKYNYIEIKNGDLEKLNSMDVSALAYFTYNNTTFLKIKGELIGTIVNLTFADFTSKLSKGFLGIGNKRKYGTDYISALKSRYTLERI